MTNKAMPPLSHVLRALADDVEDLERRAVEAEARGRAAAAEDFRAKLRAFVDGEAPVHRPAPAVAVTEPPATAGVIIDGGAVRPVLPGNPWAPSDFVTADHEQIFSWAAERGIEFTGKNLAVVNKKRVGLGLPPFALKSAGRAA